MEEISERFRALGYEVETRSFAQSDDDESEDGSSEDGSEMSLDEKK